jgi:hypothetical protein
MNHPEDLLADLVAGSIGDADRARLEAHLATCATCRRDAALATQARRALGDLGPATPPTSLAEAAIAAAVSAGGPDDLATARAARRRQRWLGAVAAAAVIVVIAVAAPKLGSPSGTSAEPAAGAGAQAAYPPASAVDVMQADLSAEQLAIAATTLGGLPAPAAAPVENGATATGAATPLPAFDARAELPNRLPAATACLDQAFDHATPGVLTRVVLARFEGTPAYFGLYAVGPGAGLAPTRLQLLVASVDGCQPLGSAYALLPGE